MQLKIFTKQLLIAWCEGLLCFLRYLLFKESEVRVLGSPVWAEAGDWRWQSSVNWRNRRQAGSASAAGEQRQVH